MTMICVNHDDVEIDIDWIRFPMNGTRTVARKIWAIHYYRIEKAIIHNLEVLLVPPNFLFMKATPKDASTSQSSSKSALACAWCINQEGRGGGGVQAPIKPLPIHLTPWLQRPVIKPLISASSSRLSPIIADQRSAWSSDGGVLIVSVVGKAARQL